MRLLAGIAALIPEKFRILVTLIKPQLIRKRFNRLPVERDGSGIEKRPEKIFVPVVALFSAQLIIIENVGSEVKRMRHLFDGNIGTVGGGQLDDRVNLAVFLDIGIYFRLDPVVPDFPVPFRHHRFIHFKCGVHGHCGEEKHYKPCTFHFISPLLRCCSFVSIFYRTITRKPFLGFLSTQHPPVGFVLLAPTDADNASFTLF